MYTRGAVSSFFSLLSFAFVHHSLRLRIRSTLSLRSIRHFIFRSHVFRLTLWFMPHNHIPQSLALKLYFAKHFFRIDSVKPNAGADLCKWKPTHPWEWTRVTDERGRVSLNFSIRFSVLSFSSELVLYTNSRMFRGWPPSAILNGCVKFDGVGTSRSLFVSHLFIFLHVLFLFRFVMF